MGHECQHGAWQLRAWQLRAWQLRAWQLRAWQLRAWQLRVTGRLECQHEAPKAVAHADQVHPCLVRAEGPLGIGC